MILLAAPAVAGAETVMLDTFEAGTPAMPMGDGAAGPVSTATPVAAGTVALVSVRGTMSAFRAHLWAPAPGFHICGTPEPAPLFPSPGIVNGPVGTDSEFNFARPRPNSVFCAVFPNHQVQFQIQINTGGGYQHYEPVAGVPAAPSSSHEYVYALAGTGEPLRFRQLDGNTDDNYGQYQITVLTKDGCKKGGWAAFGVFKNQGDCVSYFATGGRNAPALSQVGPPVAAVDD